MKDRPLPDHLVLVSGAPGAGKTTLAVPLAKQLGLPLFSKDFIKESLAETLGGPTDDLGESRRLGNASMELLWMLAKHAPKAVLEANFRPHSSYERERLARLGTVIIEVHCDCGAQEAARRFRVRSALASHHHAHPLKQMPPEMLAEYDRPVGIGSLIEVDTSMPVDVERLADAIQARLG